MPYSKHEKNVFNKSFNKIIIRLSSQGLLNVYPFEVGVGGGVMKSDEKEVKQEDGSQADEDVSKSICGVR